MALEGRLLCPWRRHRFARFGKDSFIHRPCWLYGEFKIAVGSGVMCMHHAWLAAERPNWAQQGPLLAIGNGVGIRRGVTISAMTSVVIEDDVLLAGGVTIVDSDHTIVGPRERGSNPVWNPMLSDPIRVGRGSWIAEHSVVLRGADIGAFCVIGANSVVKGEIPDYSIAVGSPARVVGTTRT